MGTVLVFLFLFVIFFVSITKMFNINIITLITSNSNVLIGAIILVIVLFIVSKYNKLIKYKNNVSRSKGTIDVYLKKRFDLIPNLVKVVKEYAKYEEKVLKELVEIRNKFNNEKIDDIKDKEELYNKSSKIFATIESYPELKANDNFSKLMDELADVEDEIGAARRIYNIDVTEYNTEISKFPNNIIASLFRFKEEQFFEIKENERTNIKV